MRSKLIAAAGIVGLALSGAESAPSGSRTRKDAPPLPYEDQGACPFECCVYRTWSVLIDTDIMASRRGGAKVVFRARKGEEVTGVTGVVVTTRFGRAIFEEAAALAGRPVESGAVIPVLNYMGEGVWKVWVQGAVSEASLLETHDCRYPRGRAEPSCNVQLHERPKTIWWVKIRNKAGQEGWTREVSHFGNKDTCG